MVLAALLVTAKPKMTQNVDLLPHQFKFYILSQLVDIFYPICAHLACFEQTEQLGTCIRKEGHNQG